MLKVSCIRNSGQKHLFLTNIKKTKETVKIFRYWLYYYQKCKIEIFLNLCTELASYNETVQFC